MKSLLMSSLAIAALSVAAVAQDVVVTRAEHVADGSQQLERIRQVVRSLGPRASTPAQLVQLARELPAEAAARLFLEVGAEYLAGGHWDVGAAVLLALLERYPDEPAAAEGTLALVRLYSSSEVAHSQCQGDDAAAELRLPPGWRKKQASAGQTERDAGMSLYSLHVANGRLQGHPELAENSPLAFQCAVAARLSGDSQQQKSWLSLVKHKREAGDWRTRAQAEQWLEESRRGESPLPVTRCVPADRLPLLDGVLDDACWRNALSVLPHFNLYLAYDAEHLYLAANCQKLIGGDYSADSRPRTYDADLAGHDQVRLWLDTDRDYATWFELAVDHRGWTGDRCWRNADWNPKWFVAAGSEGSAWTVEAAISWSELAARPPRAGEVWALAAERVAPEAAAADRPGGWGLLVFE